MLRWLIRRRLDAEERQLGESMDYLRHVVEVSPVALLRFAAVMPMANCRKVLPVEAWFVTQIVSVQHEDCGTCLQIAVNLARQSGVDAALVRATLDGNFDEMSQEMIDVYQFARSVVSHAGDEEALRETLRKRYGERGLIELAYAIASSRIPPTVKRALGYAKSCSMVSVQV